MIDILLSSFVMPSKKSNPIKLANINIRIPENKRTACAGKPFMSDQQTKNKTTKTIRIPTVIRMENHQFWSREKKVKNLYSNADQTHRSNQESECMTHLDCPIRV